MSSRERISPTAYYTGHVWQAHGLSHPAFFTRRGSAMHAGAAPLLRCERRYGGEHVLDAMLLQRHRLIDARVERAIVDEGVRQIVEIAGGLSGRGVRLVGAHPDVRVIEGDLPSMTAEKQRRMRRAGLGNPRHVVVPCDALRDDGPMSLVEATAPYLDRDAPVLIVTEGLVNYFTRSDVEELWARLARFGARFPRSMYLTEVMVADTLRTWKFAPMLTALLSRFASGTYIHYQSPEAVRSALRSQSWHRVRHVAGGEGETPTLIDVFECYGAADRSDHVSGADIASAQSALC